MKISEIFWSIQGEGRSQGIPCLFLRLAGCNIQCSWCDTPQTDAEVYEMTPEEIREEIRRRGVSSLCITGGEPLLQKEELERLFSSDLIKDMSVEIETNGTRDFTSLQPYASICMDVKCPSSGEKSDLTLLSQIRPVDSVKFVVKDRADCLYAQSVIEKEEIKGEIFFSPVFGTDYGPISDFVLSLPYPVRLQIQLHKIIGVR